MLILLLQSKVFKLLGHVAPQLGIKGIDPNDISSIPEEVYTCTCMYGLEEFNSYYMDNKRWDEHD